MKQKTAAAILIVFAMILALAACKGGSSGEEESTGEFASELSEEAASLIAEYTPDGEGNFVTKTRSGEDGAVIAEYYNNDGKLVEAHNWNGSSETGHTVYSYNDNGDISMEQSYDATNTPNAVVQYNYSSDGALAGSSKTTYANGMSTGSEYFDSTGKLTSSSEYEYDGTKLKKITRRNAEGSVTGYTDYEYNDAGYIIKVTERSADDKLAGYSELTYDDNHNLIRTDMYDAEGKLTGYYENTYNENNIRTGTTQYDADGNIITSDTVKITEEASIAG